MELPICITIMYRYTYIYIGIYSAVCSAIELYSANLAYFLICFWLQHTPSVFSCVGASLYFDLTSEIRSMDNMINVGDFMWVGGMREWIDWY